MKKNKEILIFGAGAIGRGFLAPKFFKKNYSISFIDNNKDLVKKLKNRKKYTAAFTNGKDYKLAKVYIKDIFDINEKFDISKYDLVFTCVGPKQCYEIIDKFKGAKNIISCENDFNSKKIIKEITGIKNVFFAIPDVITSNTAPENLKKIDDLCTVSEKGTLVIENNGLDLSNTAKKLSQKDLSMHWDCKLFIHNAPHAILAYLGARKRYNFIHQAMNDKKIRKILLKSMNEISLGLIKSGLVKPSFVNYYKNKEINRFENKILFDPIKRVAREPLRKLASDNRLILALRLSFLGNKFPKFTLIGLKAALNYYDKNDSDSVYLKNLSKSLTEEEILKKISGVHEKDPISLLCKKIKLKNFIN
mgnify:CR=1 FL=1